MEKFVKGDIIILPFPFSDLSDSKKRPAFVMVDLPGDDIILCQITSKLPKDGFSVPLSFNDFISGSLPVNSHIRYNRIFTADKRIIIRKAGTVKANLTKSLMRRLIELLEK